MAKLHPHARERKVHQKSYVFTTNPKKGKKVKFESHKKQGLFIYLYFFFWNNLWFPFKWLAIFLFF